MSFMDSMALNFGFFRSVPLVFSIFSLLGFELYALKGNIHSRGKRDLCERVLCSHQNPQHVQTSSNKSGNTIWFNYYLSYIFLLVKPFIDTKVMEGVQAREHPAVVTIMQFFLANKATIINFILNYYYHVGII